MESHSSQHFGDMLCGAWCPPKDPKKFQYSVTISVMDLFTHRANKLPLSSSYESSTVLGERDTGMSSSYDDSLLVVYVSFTSSFGGRKPERGQTENKPHDAKWLHLLCFQRTVSETLVFQWLHANSSSTLVSQMSFPVQNILQGVLEGWPEKGASGNLRTGKN